MNNEHETAGRDTHDFPADGHPISDFRRNWWQRELAIFSGEGVTTHDARRAAQIAAQLSLQAAVDFPNWRFTVPARFEHHINGKVTTVIDATALPVPMVNARFQFDGAAMIRSWSVPVGHVKREDDGALTVTIDAEAAARALKTTPHLAEQLMPGQSETIANQHAQIVALGDKIDKLECCLREASAIKRIDETCIENFQGRVADLEQRLTDYADGVARQQSRMEAKEVALDLSARENAELRKCNDDHVRTIERLGREAQAIQTKATAAAMEAQDYEARVQTIMVGKNLLITDLRSTFEINKAEIANLQGVVNHLHVFEARCNMLKNMNDTQARTIVGQDTEIEKLHAKLDAVSKAKGVAAITSYCENDVMMTTIVDLRATVEKQTEQLNAQSVRTAERAEQIHALKETVDDKEQQLKKAVECLRVADSLIRQQEELMQKDLAEIRRLTGLNEETVKTLGNLDDLLCEIGEQACAGLLECDEQIRKQRETIATLHGLHANQSDTIKGMYAEGDEKDAVIASLKQQLDMPGSVTYMLSNEGVVWGGAENIKELSARLKNTDGDLALIAQWKGNYHTAMERLGKANEEIAKLSASSLRSEIGKLEARVASLAEANAHGQQKTCCNMKVTDNGRTHTVYGTAEAIRVLEARGGEWADLKNEAASAPILRQATADLEAVIVKQREKITALRETSTLAMSSYLLREKSGLFKVYGTEAAITLLQKRLTTDKDVTIANLKVQLKAADDACAQLRTRADTYAQKRLSQPSILSFTETVDGGERLVLQGTSKATLAAQKRFTEHAQLQETVKNQQAHLDRYHRAANAQRAILEGKA